MAQKEQYTEKQVFIFHKAVLLQLRHSDAYLYSIERMQCVSIKLTMIPLIDKIILKMKFKSKKLFPLPVRIPEKKVPVSYLRSPLIPQYKIAI